MASIKLYGVHIALVSELGTGTNTVVRLNAGVTVEQSGGIQARRVIGANGRARVIRRPGRHVVLSVEAPRIDRTTRETLEAWEGELCFLRDGRGRVAYGFYAEPDFAEQPGPGLCDLSMTFQTVSEPA